MTAVAAIKLAWDAVFCVRDGAAAASLQRSSCSLKRLNGAR